MITIIVITLQVVIAADGSSRLAPESRWGDFWSVSGMWHLSSEPFMEAVKPVLNDVKIRASYGVNGNQPGAFTDIWGYTVMGRTIWGQQVHTSLLKPIPN